jgi:hypothetical protein
MQSHGTGLTARCRFVGALVATALLLAGIAGCGAKGAFETARVHGKVTYQGQPLATGSLVFVPVAGGPSAQANLDSNGNYVLGTYSKIDGAVPGEHEVMIIALTGGDGPQEATDLNAVQKSLIPSRYGDLKKSGLRPTVKPKTDNEINFELKDGK